MIKRQYFIATEALLPDKTLTKSWSVSTRTSWLPQTTQAVVSMIEDVASTVGVDHGDVVVTAFNKV